jgi:hypothetical protein
MVDEDLNLSPLTGTIPETSMAQLIPAHSSLVVLPARPQRILLTEEQRIALSQPVRMKVDKPLAENGVTETRVKTFVAYSSTFGTADASSSRLVAIGSEKSWPLI